MRLFGFRFGKSQKELQQKEIKSFVSPNNNDGSLVVETGPGVSVYTVAHNFSTTINNKNDLIRRYREMALYSEVENAISEIINEMVIMDDEAPPISLVINENNYKMSDALKEAIEKEFNEVLRLLNFNQFAYDIICRWYVDGRIYYHMVVNPDKLEAGIQELRYIDPRHIEKTRWVEKIKEAGTNLSVVNDFEEFYWYDPSGIGFYQPPTQKTTPTMTGVKLPLEQVAYCHSGLLDEGSRVISYLHKALKPYNQLNMMEDSLVVYRVTRSQERRIFNIDVGELVPTKARQFIESLITQYKTKMIYDSHTGEIRDDRRHMTMVEDFWFPKRSDGRGSDVQTLPAGQNLGEISDVEYFKRKLYKSLHIPVSRLETTSAYSFNRTAEITRDELKFSKFITRLRHRFTQLFDDILKTQLVLKKITTPDDWEYLKECIYYDFLSDSHFTEAKEAELLKMRLDLLDQAKQHEGEYYSKHYIRRNILRLSDNAIEEIENQIEDEKNKKMKPKKDEVLQEPELLGGKTIEVDETPPSEEEM